jgi:hypothetical protein
MLYLLMNKLSKFTWSSLLYPILNLNFKIQSENPKIGIDPVPEKSGFSDFHCILVTRLNKTAATVVKIIDPVI